MDKLVDGNRDRIADPKTYARVPSGETKTLMPSLQGM